MSTTPTGSDLSKGWEAVAPAFIREGGQSRVGVAVVTDWVNQLPLGSALLDLGCGPGVPRSEPLHARGVVYAIDASPSLARSYQERFPDAHVACEPAETSALFGRQFDGVLAWGLLFLLPGDVQKEVIRRVASAEGRRSLSVHSALADGYVGRQLDGPRVGLSGDSHLSSTARRYRSNAPART